MTLNQVRSSRLALSVVVVAYDMARELPRTLRSLAPGYQRGIAADEYEVDDYRRISVPLRSGPRAWVYVFAG